jgi:hypothetical protein
MRKLAALSFGLLIAFGACKKEKSTTNTNTTTTQAKPGNIQVAVINQADGVGLNFGQFTNPNGDLYSVNVLKYYISDFSLIGVNNDTVVTSMSELINEKDTASCRFTVSNVKGGDYKAIRFYIGVPEERNHTGLQLGDLDPSYGMLWDWRTGYIFFKHEGTFSRDSVRDQFLIYHYGTDASYCAVDIPMDRFTVNGGNTNLQLTFNLNNLYNAPNKISFLENNSHQSTALADSTWLRKLKANFPNCFTIQKVN